MTSSSGDKNNEELAFGALILAAAFLVLSPVFYAVAATATLVGSGSLPPYWEAAIGTVQIPWHLSDPASAYGPELAASMPAGGRWWLSVGAIDGAILVGVGLCLLRVGLVVGRVRGRRRLDVRWWDPRRRLKPRAWARPRDLIHLQPRGRSGSSSAWARATGRFLRWAYRERRAPDRAGGDSWFMGRLRGAELRSVPETHLLGLAPTQAGKTTRIVIPEAIEHQGPLVVLSNKTDVLDATAESRSAVGPVWVIAPLTRLGRHGDHRRGWTPLSSCREWEGALRMGQWMFDADPAATATSTSSGGARFYNRESVSALLPPLLHAAALDGRDMATVLAWVRAGVEGLDEPREVLSEQGATAAASAIAGVQALDDRPRSLLLMSCAQLIDGYRFPSVQASDREGFDPRALLHGGTLYLVARESEQELLAPIFGGILGAILRVFEDEAADCGRPPQRPLKILADEAAHLAPLSKLPTYLAVSRSWGVRWCLLYQSVAQMQRRYGDEHQALLANTLVKVILGPIHDEATRKVVVDLLDEEATTARSRTSRSFGGNDSTTRHERHVGKASAESLRQLSEHEAIVIHGRDLPAVTTLLPWWKRRDLAG